MDVHPDSPIGNAIKAMPSSDLLAFISAMVEFLPENLKAKLADEILASLHD